MRKNLTWKSFLNRSSFSNRVQPYPTRPFCSSTRNNKPTAVDASSSDGSSLGGYDEQYKALDNLDFTKAAKILFSDPPQKKEFGLDFHLVQLFFVCLPSLAVYLVAQYARSEMRKMDAELEKKKQAEFEAQAKEMELKAAEEKAATASNPELLEVRERLDKLEVAIKEIVVESKKQLSAAIRTRQEDGDGQKQPSQFIKPDNSRNDPVGHGTTSMPVGQEAKK